MEKIVICEGDFILDDHEKEYLACARRCDIPFWFGIRDLLTRT
jgi:hypothetical protein